MGELVLRVIDRCTYTTREESMQDRESAFTTTTANTALRETLRINSDEVRRYIRAVITVAGGTGAGAVSVVALGSKKYG